MTIDSDNPITHASEDELGRALVARGFVRQVLSLDSSGGLVVGVLGSWGSGKTSFINLARSDFADAEVSVLDFNPWMFSGAEQLVQSFFIEVSAQLRLRAGLAEIAGDLADYGETFGGLGWLPLVGPWIERGRGATKLLSKLLRRRREGVGDRRTKLEAALSKLERPIVVVLDDIDRLSTAEIRDIFKLVRLTASFPNVVYAVAFDRHRVESALGEDGIPGRDYLEKILQLAVDLPSVPDHVLNGQIFAVIDGALATIDTPGDLDERAWPDVFMEVIRPLIRNMRDVRRYAAAVHGTVEALGGQVALADVLGLEAVRVFLPDVFREFPAAVEGLTTPSSFMPSSYEDPELKASVERLVKAGGDRESVVRAMISRLFPAAERYVGGTSYGGDWMKTWLRERRVAKEEILRLYLERTVGDRLEAFQRAQRAFEAMTDRGTLHEYLESIPLEERETVIGALENFEEQFQPEHVVPGTIELLNQLSALPERPRGMTDLDTRLVVGRVTYRLIRSLQDPDAIVAAVREILPEVESLSSKFELITDVGSREGAGHKLVSESDAVALEAEWRAEVRAASVAQFLTEWDLLRVLIFANRDLQTDEPRVEIPADPLLTLAIIRAAKSEARSQTLGSRAVRRSPRLAWDVLVDLFGGEEHLRERLNDLRTADLEGSTQLLDLADQYLSGWRPDRFS